MLNPLVCSSCNCKIKAKSEQAGRKIKCPRCGNVIAVPKDDAVEAEAVTSARDVTRKKTRQVDVGDAEVERPIKKESVLNTDVGELNQSFNNFDVSRFTLVGWLAFVVAVALALGAVALVDLNYETIMDIPRDQKMYTKHYAAHGIAAAVVGLGCFFGALVILKLAGIKLIRPKAEAGA